MFVCYTIGEKGLGGASMNNYKESILNLLDNASQTQLVLIYTFIFNFLGLDV